MAGMLQKCKTLKMIKIQLNRSGGMLGKNLKAVSHIDIDEKVIIKKLTMAAPVQNPYARDDFNYSINVNEKEFPVDVSLLKGELKKIINKLEDNLKAEND